MNIYVSVCTPMLCGLISKKDGCWSFAYLLGIYVGMRGGRGEYADKGGSVGMGGHDEDADKGEIRGNGRA